MDDAVLANRLAALSTLLDDALFRGVDDLSPSAVAALQVIRAREQVSIGAVASMIGLTHSATVRLIDRLEKDWYVRRLARKGREVLVEVTARGKRRAAELAGRRIEAAGLLLSVLDAGERQAISGALDRMLAAPIDSVVTAERVCRLCAREACRAADCPVEAAGARRG
jgi:DNA-binding MarR family transcriptional regulator